MKNVMTRNRAHNKVHIGITGASGGLGQRLTELAINKGYSVRCLVRKDSKIDNLTQLNAEIHYGDITNIDTLIDFVKGIDVCIHLAAHVGFGTKEQYRQVNSVGTDNICQAIVNHNLNCRFLYCSTISVLRLNKWIKILNTNYANSKYFAEKTVEYYAKNKGLKETIIYPGLIYGPYDENFVPTIIRYLNKGKMIFVSGGEKDAPLIYIDDLCELFLLCASREESTGKKYIGIGKFEIGIHEFVNNIAKKKGYSFQSIKIPKAIIFPLAVLLDEFYELFRINKSPIISKRAVDVMSINFNRSLKDDSLDLGWTPRVSVHEGLNNALDWYDNKVRSLTICI